ncbi:MAG: arginase family protein [Tistlia sp.]|uniref:arginase family protein n=1 Tax=Tistlia sp. TaxID=3057121 RepID=UPI0034A1DFD7
MTVAQAEAVIEDLLRPSQARLFGAPAWMPEGTFDVVALGVPSDTGNLGSPRSAAAGVPVLRGASRMFPYRLDEHKRPVGWYDYERARPLLSGVRLADAGDLMIDRYDPTAALDRLPEVLRALKRTARLVLILGGDHAITHWTAGALPDDSRVVLFDAHEDATAITGPLPHAGNVARFLERRANVASILQYGLRGLVPGDRAPPAPHRVLCADADALAAACVRTAGAATLLSIDVDVISPEILRAVAAPSPGGLHPRELAAAAAAIGRSGGRVQYLEIAEFAPGPSEDPLAAMTLMQLVVRLLDACLEAPS